MKNARLSLVLLSIFVAASVLNAQPTAFNDVNVDYTFLVPSSKWKMVKSGAAGNVEFVYVDRNDGHLEVRKLGFPANTPWADIIQKQQDSLQFSQGYVAGKQENFVGKLTDARIFNYEFVRSGRPMSGRMYFLRAGDSVYLLRFTGFQDSLRSIRTDTDLIGRSFEIKKS